MGRGDGGRGVRGEGMGWTGIRRFGYDLATMLFLLSGVLFALRQMAEDGVGSAQIWGIWGELLLSEL